MVRSGFICLSNENGGAKRHFWKADVRNERSGNNINGGFIKYIHLSGESGETLGHRSNEYCAAPKLRAASELIDALIERYEWEVRNENL